MSQSKAREARQTIPTHDREAQHHVDRAIRDERAAQTQERQQALTIEKADIKAERLANRAKRGAGFAKSYLAGVAK